MASRAPMASSRAAGSGGTDQMAVPAAAVAPLCPQRPLSARITDAPARRASMAAQVPAGPPPTTSTSVSISSIASSTTRTG
jgi:hypothetical protein